jgi:hypothetical protein
MLTAYHWPLSARTRCTCTHSSWGSLPVAGSASARSATGAPAAARRGRLHRLRQRLDPGSRAVQSTASAAVIGESVRRVMGGRQNLARYVTAGKHLVKAGNGPRRPRCRPGTGARRRQRIPCRRRGEGRSSLLRRCCQEHHHHVVPERPSGRRAELHASACRSPSAADPGARHRVWRTRAPPPRTRTPRGRGTGLGPGRYARRRALARRHPDSARHAQ